MSKRYRVVPAILTDRKDSLEHMARQAESFTSRVQIDIMDGRFVPSHSIKAGDILKSDIKIDWEAHLMIFEPEKYIAEYAAAGARRIIVHYEAAKKNTIDVLRMITSLGIGAGIAVNPETSLDVLGDGLISEIESVLFMAVHPGFYGAKFIPQVLSKIQELMRLFPDISIGIDGGIKLDNIQQAVGVGANEIRVGSAIFGQPDPASAYNQLLNLAQIGWNTCGGS